VSALGFAVYAACVDFLLKAAALAGVSYRDANAFLFFILWPLVTIALVVIVLVQGVQLRRRRRATS
jgi:hypothetical protein